MSKKVYYNGNIYIGKDGDDRKYAEYMIVDDNKIAEIGNGFKPDDSMEAIDLEGRFVYPGFIDSHAHPFTSAFQLSQIVIDFEASYDEAMETVKSYVAAHPEKDAYFGVGYNEALFGKAGPNKHILDELCPDKPLLLVAASGHESCANSKALEITGADANHPDPAPGLQYYKRDEKGEPTGWLIEGDPMKEVIYAIKPFDLEEVQETLMKIFDDFASYGITTVGDCGFAPYIKGEAEELMDMVKEKGLLKQRFFGSNHINAVSETVGWEEHLKHLHDKYGDDMVAFNTFKIVNDGIVENCSASMFEPFIGQDKAPDPVIFGDDLINICLRAAELGYDVHLHGIGDRTIHENLMAAKAIREAGYKDTIITNAHTQCVADEDIPLFAKYDVIANTSSVWHYGNPEYKVLLEERADRMFPLHSIIAEGAKMTGSSDFPGDEMGPHPLRAMETGMTRQMLGDPDSLMMIPDSERLTIDEVFDSYTYNAAYQLRMDKKLGTLEVGKYADMVVLDKDLFNCDVYEIHAIPVHMTIMDGKVTYRK